MSEPERVKETYGLGHKYEVYTLSAWSAVPGLLFSHALGIFKLTLGMTGWVPESLYTTILYIGTQSHISGEKSVLLVP